MLVSLREKVIDEEIQNGVGDQRVRRGAARDQAVASAFEDDEHVTYY